MPIPAPPSGRPDHLSAPGAALAIATERLYAAFASLPFDPTMVRMPGVSDDDVAALGAPVGSLDPALLSRFILKAGTTWGAPADVRRVAPRALELAANHQLPIDRGLLWAKLRWAGWPEWPTYQVVTVRAFLRAEWIRLLCAEPRPAHLAYRRLSHPADGLGDIREFLADWLETMGPNPPPAHQRAATGHLVVLLIGSPLRPDQPRTATGLFPGNPAAAAQLTAWLTSPHIITSLERSAAALSGTADSRRVALALERLARFRAAVQRSIHEAGSTAPDA